MAGRSQLPVPTRSVQRVTSVVRTVVETPAQQPRPAMSRLPRPSGLRMPRSYRPPPVTPGVAQVRGPRPSRLRPPQIRSGLRPPQASGLRAPRPVCRLPQRVRTPPRARSPSPCAARPPSPCAPAPCAPPPCAPQPCPAASPLSVLRAMETDEEAAVREALRAQWEAALACPPESPEQRRRREEQCLCEERAERAREQAEAELDLAAAKTELMWRELQESRRDYELTREAVAEMLIEDRDMMLRAQQERMMRRLQGAVCSEAQWRACLGLLDEWRRNMLEDYIPFAVNEAVYYAGREQYERKRRQYRQRLRPRRPPLCPLVESQVDVFDDSPPRAGSPPLLPERVFDAPPPCAPTYTLMDSSPPLDTELPPPLLRSYRSPSPLPATPEEEAEDDWYLEFDALRDPRRELLFDSEDDDDSQLEGAVGGAYI